MEERLMILPPPPFCMCGIACLVQKKTPFTLMPRTLSHSSSVISWVGLFTPAIPALFTSTSSLPNRVWTAANTVFTSFSSVTSRCRKSALPPLLRISSTSFFPFTSEMSVTTAMAPSFASKRHAARPIPWAPPVTMATLSFTLFIMPIRSHVLSVQSQSTLRTRDSFADFDGNPIFVFRSQSSSEESWCAKRQHPMKKGPDRDGSLGSVGHGEARIELLDNSAYRFETLPCRLLQSQYVVRLHDLAIEHQTVIPALLPAKIQVGLHYCREFRLWCLANRIRRFQPVEQLKKSLNRQQKHQFSAVPKVIVRSRSGHAQPARKFAKRKVVRA